MSDVVSNIGKEWFVEDDFQKDGATVSIGVYNDANDNFQEGDTLADINEPTNSNYSRDTTTISTGQISAPDYGFESDSQVTFDFSDVAAASEIVDSWIVVETFTSTLAGDSGPTAHVIATGSLDQQRDIGTGGVDTVNIAAGGVQVLLGNP